MFASFLPLRTVLLGALSLGLLPISTRAEAPRFARGFVIYKKALSDLPTAYNGTLYLSTDTSGPIWLQYEIGQPKPFFLARESLVTDIRFGALFEADFTTQQHADHCKGIQAQLTAAAKQSPLLASAANAAVKAIQAEVDHYEKGQVRLSGAWTDRSKYEEILAEKAKARKAEEERRMKVAAEVKAEEEAARRMREAMAEDDKLRLANLNRTYASAAVQNLIASLEDTIKASSTILGNNAALPARPPARATLDTYIPLPFFREAPRVDTRLQILGPADTETVPAILTTYDLEATRLLIVQAAFYLESTGPGQPFLPRSKSEYAAVRQALDAYHPSICESVPDLIAADRIMGTLRDVVPNDRSTPFNRLAVAGYSVRYDVYAPEPREDRYLRLMIITLFPEG
jgi:hypothetical protein